LNDEHGGKKKAKKVFVFVIAYPHSQGSCLLIRS
jgi:hypothetical protein